MMGATHASAQPSGGAPDVVRVLLVEDDEDDLELTTDLLASIRDGRRYEVSSTACFDEALEALSAGRYDVTLLDHFLGRWNGLDLLAEAAKVGTTVPVIFLTGRGTAGIEQRALAAGAADYLVKGEIDVAVLERSIRHSLERARSLEALRARERQFRSVFEAANDALLVADDDARYLDANAAALNLLGVTRARLLEMNVFDVMSPEAQAPARVAWRSFIERGSAEGEMVVRRADGTERIVEFRATSGITPGRHLSILRDVTERRSAEEQRLRLAAIVESAADAISIIALDGRIEYWSPSSERLYGYSAAEVVGQPKHIVVPECERDVMAELFERVRRGEAVRDHETLRRRKDGTIFVATVTVSPVHRGGEIVAFSTIARDVTEKKKLEAHLAVSDRMASVGTLAAGVAHEINNPLAVVIANLEIAASAASLDGEALADARMAADRIRHVVRDLKLFSRPDEARRGPVDVQRLIDSSARMAWNEIRHRAQLVKDFADVPRVDGSEARLGQVILNLVINAAQAIREGNARGNEIRLVTRTDASGHVVIEVTDTGDGIAKEHLARIFEPFFTTKPVGVGTGLGLSICKRIVEDMGGTIAVESEIERGTTVRVTLPAAKQAAEEKEVATISSRRADYRARVLIIDDDPLILKAARRSLALHHDVVTMPTAADGLREISRGSFDAILCDMMMPQMTGMAFYEALLVLCPELAPRVAFMTGGAFTRGARDFLKRVSNPVVDKPFDSTRLLQAIDEVMVAALADRHRA